MSANAWAQVAESLVAAWEEEQASRFRREGDIRKALRDATAPLAAEVAQARADRDAALAELAALREQIAAKARGEAPNS